MSNESMFIAGAVVGFIAAFVLALLYAGAVYLAKKAEEEIERENNTENYD